MKRLYGVMRVVVLFLLVAPAAANAQASDPRLLQLEEQVRVLTGQIEELNFQLLQLQETIRRQQEDNEYRLQELEKQQQGSLETDGVRESDLAAAPASPEAPVEGGTVAAPADVATAPVPTNPDVSPRLGTPPQSLGTITVDGQGNILGATVDFSGNAVESAIDGTNVASVTGEMNPEELYQTGYEHVLQGDYSVASDVFARFVDIYPDDPLAPDAHFWLGESLLGQGRLEEAADAFITTRTLYPRAEKAPETMLKIGTILAALGNREVACVTFADAVKTHPGMTASVRARIDQEAAKAQC